MKILEIELNNINALRGEHKVNFREEPFLTAGLFAITGATGSGKTTLLDVISLALFNRIPRHEKTTLNTNYLDSTGAVITRNTREAYAAVTYSCDSGIYRSIWSVHITRNNTMADYKMEIADYKTGKLLPLKKSEIPKKNEALIGLSYEQFIRAIVLAQGDFAKFLKSKKDERNELLEQITGTEIYRELGIMAFRNAREVENKVKELETLAIHVEQKLKSAEELEVLTKNKVVLDEEVKELEEQLNKIENQLRIYKELRTLKAKKTQQSEDLQRVKNQMLEFQNKKGDTLSINEKLMPFREDIINFTQIKKEIESKTCELKNILNEEKELQAVREKLRQKGSELGVESADLEDLIDKTEDKLRRYRETERELQRTKEEYAEKRKAVATAVKENPTEIQPDYKIHFDRKLKTAEAAFAELQNEITKNTSLPQTEEELDQVREVFYERKTERAERNRTAESVDQLTRKLKALNEKLNELPAAIEKAENEHNRAKLQLTNLKQQKEIQTLRASLEEHRERLIDGEPCPLCGSEHHPFAAGAETDKNIEDVEIAKAEEKEKDLSSVLQNLRFDLKSQMTGKKEMEDELHRRSAALSSSKEKESLLQSRLPADWRELSDAELNTAVDYRKKILNRCRKEERRVENLKAVYPAVEDLSNLFKRGQTQRDNLEALYAGKDFAARAAEVTKTGRKTLTKSLTNQTEKNGAHSELSKLKERQKEVSNQISSPLQERGYATIENAAENLIPLTALEQIRHEKESLIRNQTTINQNILNIREEIAEREKACDLKDPEKTQAEKEAAATTLKSKKENLKNMEFTLTKNTENQTEVSQHRKNIKRLKTENRGVLALKTAIGDANGQRFREFAQKLTLRQLTTMANNRLQNLSDRYQLDVPGKNEGDDLVIVDMDMGEARRAATTLSGGETFLVSLALALALSDLAAQSVKIESMFIDEGFGTLDPETLDKTLDVLEKLQAADEKSIGVISHVSTLKERITTQIILTQTGRGYSEMKIAG